MEWEDLQELRDHNMERRAFDEQGWLDHEEEVSAFLIQSLKLTHTDGALVTGLATQMQFYSLKTFCNKLMTPKYLSTSFLPSTPLSQSLTRT